MDADDAAIAEEFQACGSAEAFYHGSQRYLYHLTRYFLEGWKRLGYGLLFQILAGRPGHPSILDYGCGIGADGLWFLEGGLPVSFADFDSPARRYLAWRLARRGPLGDAPIYDLTEAIPRHDVVWCVDVLEHLPPCDHLSLVRRLCSLGRFVVMNLVDDRQADGQVHFPVDVETVTTALQQASAQLIHVDLHQKPDGSKVRFLALEVAP